MENQNFYEGRILVNMAAFVMRQDDLKPLHGNLDWEKLFRVADYNKISNLIYLAILGNNEKIPERWKTRFYDHIKDCICAVSAVCRNMDRSTGPAFADTDISGCYTCCGVIGGIR